MKKIFIITILILIISTSFMLSGCIEVVDSSEDDSISLGNYPQSLVTDADTLSQLATITGNLPTTEDKNDWNDYGYANFWKEKEYMWCKDVLLHSTLYRAVYIEEYRPDDCLKSISESNSYQDDNGYLTKKIYWFKYEPLKWRILHEENGQALVICENAIDSQQFDYDGTAVNNYKDSTLRKWLTEKFYTTAFAVSERNNILKTEIDNSAESTGNNNNQFICENTEDRIFLLSYSEAKAYYSKKKDRMMKSTDYAKIQGCYTCNYGETIGYCFWWLRSPDSSSSTGAKGVDTDGSIDYGASITSTRCGIVPAMIIKR